MCVSDGLNEGAVVCELGDAVAYSIDEDSFDAVGGAQSGVVADVS